MSSPGSCIFSIGVSNYRYTWKPDDSIVLSEVSVENFEHAWKRFRLAATAKQWQEEKQLQILPIVEGQSCGLLHVHGP